LAGLTVARELARRNWSVAVLEAQRIAWSASGRNCGFVLPGFAETMGQIAERVGLDTARAMWALADAGRAYVRETIAETAMPGADPVDGWLRVAKFDEDLDLADNADWLREQFAAEVELWPSEKVRAWLRAPAYCNAVHFPTAFHIHPLNYALGLAAAAERAGVRIFEGTPAQELDPAGVRKRVTTPSARVRAAKIVLAGSVHLGPLQPRLSATLMPVTTFVAVTAPIGEQLREVIRYTGAVSDTGRVDNHYRIVGGDRLLWAGGMRTWDADPRPFARRLRADIRRTYPQLGAVEIEHVWSGTLGRTVHRMPQIGELAPGIWVASGFDGHGLNTTAMAGMLIARAIVDNDPTWRLFEPYELVWAGGKGGAAVLQASYAGLRLRERMHATGARWRHRKRWPKAIVPPVPVAPAKAGTQDEFGQMPVAMPATAPGKRDAPRPARSRRKQADGPATDPGPNVVAERSQ
jgi:glycine/D-amino acid oxidase-like deaminating enzyme